MTNAVNIAQGGSNNVTFRNKIINGAMLISQRGTSFTGLTDGYNATYTLDRWSWSETGTSTGVQTITQDTSAPAGYINSLKVLTTTAHTVGSGNGYNIAQWVEGLNVTDLAWGTASAKAVTISFWVKSSLTGTFAAALGNSAFDTSYVFNYTISTANTWEQKTATIAGPTSGTFPTDNGRSFRLIVDLGTGSTYQTATTNAWISANAWSTSSSTSIVGTLNATLAITGVQLEAGTTASPFEYRQYGTELSLCQRYYEVWYNGTNGGPNSSLLTGSANWLQWLFKQEKRASPTVALGSGSTWQGTTPTSYPSTSCGYWYAGGYFYVGQTSGVGLTASAEL